MERLPGEGVGDPQLRITSPHVAREAETDSGPSQVGQTRRWMLKSEPRVRARDRPASAGRVGHLRLGPGLLQDTPNPGQRATIHLACPPWPVPPSQG